jgi:L-2-hydroxycarboxylate dehydrogenase (NAD+)
MVEYVPGVYEKTPAPPEDYVRVKADELRELVKKVFVKLGVPEQDAWITADNLVEADLRGIESHGVQRLKRYVNGLKAGSVKARPEIRVVREGPSYAVVDGDMGLGQVVSSYAVKLAVEKARKADVAMVVVRNSNHYGIAGYWSTKIMEEDMLGVSMTNSRPLVAYTGTLKRIIGTNPISIAAPTLEPPPFILDMATSVVPSGKLEVYRRKGKKIPLGWAIGPDGKLTDNPEVAMKEGALLPLGGLGELLGGHKGSGLSVMVDILSGVLSGAAWGPYVGYTVANQPPNVGHFFMAVNIEAFMPLDEFKKRMTEYVRTLKSIEKHPDFDYIWIPGEKSWMTRETRLRKGVPVYKKVFNEIKEICGEVGVEFALNPL